MSGKSINTLLLTGANNHDWQRTTPYFAQLLENDGHTVTVSENPSETLEQISPWSYDLIVLDYNGPEWSAEAKENFLNAIDFGTGLAVIHAADNAFPGWEEYEKLCGLVFRQESGHGDFHTFSVEPAGEGHPIVDGLLPFETTDELYHRMFPAAGSDYEVLATALSSPESKGTGQTEPMIVINQHGAGRIFHTLLGHVWPGQYDGSYLGVTMVAVENPGFVETLKRGCRWAATGSV